MKSRNFWIAIAISFIFLSSPACSSPKNLSGHYRTKNKPSFWDYFYFFRPYALSVSLDLNKKDSTFKYQTCAYVMTGKWKREKNRLYLSCDTIFYKIDSFNFKQPYRRHLDNICRKGHVFVIKGKQLKSPFSLRHIERLFATKDSLEIRNCKK